ncbi:MAG: hypothetical protein FWD71_14375 [Oscillospiraceae bacterium]|nr:hypothetical protein [Oscillospiraceae bacterium]
MIKIFEKDELTKKERVLRTLRHQEVDRVALHDQLSYNPGVISMYTGKHIEGFDYTAEDIGRTISVTLDSCFPFYTPYDTDRYTDEYGFVYQNDNWTRWHVSRPFSDEHGAKEWLCRYIGDLTRQVKKFDVASYRKSYCEYMQYMCALAGETVIIDITGTGFCEAYDRMGLEIFSYFQFEYPDILEEYMEVSAELALRRANIAVYAEFTPVVLIAEDFATKQGPIFSVDFLNRFHFPYVKCLARILHDNGVYVIYHSDGNYKKSIPALIECGVDGFYCLEPNCGMDIVGLKHEYPEMVWAGGVDGVDLLERGTPEQTRAEVGRHITETDALKTGGMMIASSSEINPTVKPENFRAMIEAADIYRKLH